MDKSIEEITGEIVAAYLPTQRGAEAASLHARDLEEVGKRIAAMYEVIHGSVTRLKLDRIAK